MNYEVTRIRVQNIADASTAAGTSSSTGSGSSGSGTTSTSGSAAGSTTTSTSGSTTVNTGAAAIQGAEIWVGTTKCGVFPSIGGGKWYQFNCPAGTKGNYVEIKTTTAVELHLAEIEVYSSKVPEKVDANAVCTSVKW